MTIFAKTMTKAIADYRFLLRRHLPQADRMIKLTVLKLRDENTYKNDITLYKVGQTIISDIEENSDNSPKSYYAYSGIQEFCNYLKEYLSHYDIEQDQVIHRAQKASRALIQSIQLTALTREELNDAIAKKITECNLTITDFGSEEQCELQLQTLKRQQMHHPEFYTNLISHMESLMTGRCSEAA